MRGTNENLEAKAELAFEGAGECDLRTNGGWLGENVLSMDEVVFNPLVAVVGGLEGGEGVSGNSGSRPTGTRLRN
jgi:hypothetical protein